MVNFSLSHLLELFLLDLLEQALNIQLENLTSKTEVKRQILKTMIFKKTQIMNINFFILVKNNAMKTNLLLYILSVFILFNSGCTKEEETSGSGNTGNSTNVDPTDGSSFNKRLESFEFTSSDSYEYEAEVDFDNSNNRYTGITYEINDSDLEDLSYSWSYIGNNVIIFNQGDNVESYSTEFRYSNGKINKVIEFTGSDIDRELDYEYYSDGRIDRISDVSYFSRKKNINIPFNLIPYSIARNSTNNESNIDFYYDDNNLIEDRTTSSYNDPDL